MWVKRSCIGQDNEGSKTVIRIGAKVNDQQTCFESVVLSVRVGVSGVLCHLDSSNDTTGHDVGWWFWSALPSGFIDCYFGLNVRHIYPVLICLLDVK